MHPSTSWLRNIILAPALVLVGAWTCILGQDGAPQIALVVEANDVRVTVDGQPFTTYHIAQGDDARWIGPYFFPVKAADGTEVTSNHATEGGDHPHHRSLWIGHGDVNGSNTWSFDHQCQRHLRFNSVGVDSVTEELAWDAAQPGVAPVIHEQRTCRFLADADGTRSIDVISRLTADAGQAVFTVQGIADGKPGVEAGLCAVRVATPLAASGRLVNALGGSGEQACRAQPAPWCDFSGTIAGRTYGITLFDHPSNLNAPMGFHARSYGLLAHIGPGSFIIPQGATQTFHYRVVIHVGELASAAMAARYAAFAALPTTP